MLLKNKTKTLRISTLFDENDVDICWFLGESIEK